MNIKDYITKSHHIDWQPLIENGIHYEGISVKSLQFDKATNRSKAILLKFEKGLPILITYIPQEKKYWYWKEVVKYTAKP